MALNKKEYGVIAFFGVLILGVLAYGNGLFGSATKGNDSPEETADPSATSWTVPELQTQTYKRGECVTWDQTEGRSGDRSTYVVNCDDEHLMEFIAERKIEASLKEPYPGDAALDELIAAQCNGPAREYLGYELQPDGRFYVSALHPTESGWRSGDRSLQCAFHAIAVTPGPERSLGVFRGKVAGQDQALLYPSGTCINSTDGRYIPVDCAAPWELKITGNVEVEVTDRRSNYTQWAEATFDECAAATEKDYPDEFVEEKLGLSTTISEAQWDAGERTVQCAQFRDG